MFDLFKGAANFVDNAIGDIPFLENPWGNKPNKGAIPFLEWPNKPKQNNVKPIGHDAGTQETPAQLLTGGGSGGYGYGGGGGTQSDPALAAFYGDQISALQRLLGSVGTQKDQGLTRIGDSYNKSVSRTNEDRSRTLRDFEIKRDDTDRDKQSNLRKIDTNARNTSEGLRRLFGLSGAGVSSASREVAPYAVSRMASEQRGESVDKFGRNVRNIDIAADDAESQYKNVLADLLEQKSSKTEDFLRGIYGQESDLNEKLAEATVNKRLAEGADLNTARAARNPFQSAIDASMSKLNELFNLYRTPTYNVKPVDVKTPTLESYTADPMKVALEGGGLPEEAMPYLPFLRRTREFAL